MVRRSTLTGRRVAGRPLLAGLIAVVLAACGSSAGVETLSARQETTVAPETTTTAPPPDTTVPPPDTTEPPDTTADPPNTTADPPDTTAGGPTTSIAPARDLLDIGDAKQPRAYDDLIRATLADLERWWAEEYPARYGEQFEPLVGPVYAAYPERTDPIPGCGPAEQTTYEDISVYGAFYCEQGDFMVYDDGAGGILATLSDQFGPPILGVVFAHEYGHAIQSRAGEFERGLPTITTEQQADCFAGAWVARAVRGEASGITYTDADVRTGLIGMITVRDPKGIDQFEPGGHGSAFDRVGAFQVGFVEGLDGCAGLLDDPLPLVPNVYSPTEDPSEEGNAPFGYDTGQIGEFLPRDLNEFWPATVSAQGAQLTPLVLVPVPDPSAADCADPAGDIALGAVHCPATEEVVFDESFGQELYTRFGDFAVGYTLGMAWSEAAQQALDSSLAGEERALASDCLTGAWVADIIPDPDQPSPRGVYISPGDLDEAIQTALVVGDETSTENIVGSGFEKIAAFRQGVLEGIPACVDRLDG
ncbi:MAG: neutral zinc metallopeptidase [Ilumatobacteraceae bacterium]